MTVINIFERPRKMLLISFLFLMLIYIFKRPWSVLSFVIFERLIKNDVNFNFEWPQKGLLHSEEKVEIGNPYLPFLEYKIGNLSKHNNVFESPLEKTHQNMASNVELHTLVNQRYKTINNSKNRVSSK